MHKNVILRAYFFKKNIVALKMGIHKALTLFYFAYAIH